MHIYMYTFIYECMDSLYVNAYIYIYMYGASICIVYVYIIESLIVHELYIKSPILCILPPCYACTTTIPVT